MVFIFLGVHSNQMLKSQHCRDSALISLSCTLHCSMLSSLPGLHTHTHTQTHTYMLFHTCSVQFSSLAQSCLTLCNPMNCSTQRRQWQPTLVLLPGKIPWTEEPGRLQSMGSLRVGHEWATLLSLFTFMHWRRKWQPTPVFLPGESQGQRSLVGCHLWGRTESDTTEVT